MEKEKSSLQELYDNRVWPKGQYIERILFVYWDTYAPPLKDKMYFISICNQLQEQGVAVIPVPITPNSRTGCELVTLPKSHCKREPQLDCEKMHYLCDRQEKKTTLPHNEMADETKTTIYDTTTIDYDTKKSDGHMADWLRDLNSIENVNVKLV